jgi:MFS family permease
MSAVSVATSLGDVRRIAHGPMRRLFVGQLLNALGNGLTLALLVPYLSEVRKLPVSVATGLLAWQAVLALAFAPVAGSLVDRYGPRRVLLGAVLVEAVGVFTYGQVTTTQQAVGATTLVAIGGAGIWGPSSALTARLVAPEDRPTAFGFGFMLLNLGLGLGGLIGASIIDLDRPETFELLYTLTSLTYLLLFVAVLSMGNVGNRPAVGTPGHVQDEGSWRDVLRDRTLLRFALVGLILLTFGYGSVDAGLSLYIIRTVGLPEQAIGVVFATNTAMIVLLQLVVLSLVKGRSRSRSLAMVGGIWATAWLLFAAAAGVGPAWLALGLLMVAFSVFALGETLWSPVAPALLNDLAPEHLRGRYNAFQSLLWGVSGALGPLLAGAFLARGAGIPWTFTLAVGCLVAGVLALRLRRRLTPAQDGTAGGTDPVAPVPVA